MGAGAGRQMRYDIYGMRVLYSALVLHPWLLGSIAAGYFFNIRLRNSRCLLWQFEFFSIPLFIFQRFTRGRQSGPSRAGA